MTIIASPNGEGLLTSYDDLVAAITGWLHRKDLQPRVPTFIALAEVRINRIAQIRAMELEAELFMEAGERRVALPDGYSSPLAVRLNGDCRTDLTAYVAEQLPQRADPGEPCAWAIDGEYLAVDCPADVDRTLTLRYRGIFRLGPDAQTNAILRKYPDLYLYGALLESAPMIRDTDSINLWQAMYDRAVKEVNRNESRARAVAPLRTELACMLGRDRTGSYGGWQ